MGRLSCPRPGAISLPLFLPPRPAMANVTGGNTVNRHQRTGDRGDRWSFTYTDDVGPGLRLSGLGTGGTGTKAFVLTKIS